MKTKFLRTCLLAPTLAAFAATPALLASEASARAEAAISEVKGDAAKAALTELDAEMDRLETLIDSAPTPEDKAAARARLDALKERRAELRKTYVKARYDELKADVRAEANRVGNWAKRTFNRDEASNAKREVKDTLDSAKREAREAGDNAYAAASSAGAAMDLAAYKMRPTDTNKEEAKAALKALEARIDALEDRVDAMPRGAARDAAERRVDALEDRKDALESDFNKARFNALVDEVQGEWNDLVH
ncbi:MAG TPA: hypothetical protein VEA63_09620 [Opitutus sp.]|nr:hypothetical protein [Opitutus sp.]